MVDPEEARESTEPQSIQELNMARLTLDDVFNDEDEFGLLKARAPVRSMADEGDRLRVGFREIIDFVRTHGREPLDGAEVELSERKLARRLVGFRNDTSKVSALSDIDNLGLLASHPTAPPVVETFENLDEVLNDIDLEEDNGIYNLRHVRPYREVQQAEYRTERRPCKDFERFKPIFEKVQKEIDSGEREAVAFAKEQEISTGHFFILRGVVVYVAGMKEAFEKNKKINARLHLVFSNGTESDMLLRSLATELYKDPDGRRVTAPFAGPLFEQKESVQGEESGTIYILKSLSSDPEIRVQNKILHKIGVTSGSVERRIQNAENEATFLLAPVEVVATFKLFDINRMKLENMLHRFFADARADVEIKDRFGNPVRPKEWFFVTLDLIKQAIEAIEAGTIVGLRYDAQAAMLVKR